MSEIKDFSIDIPENKLEDLKKRLELTRWPEKETPDDWTQGIPLSYMKEIHEYWLNDYDWKKYILKLIDDFDLRKSMGESAREVAEKDFSTDVSISNYYKIFNEF